MLNNRNNTIFIIPPACHLCLTQSLTPANAGQWPFCGDHVLWDHIQCIWFCRAYRTCVASQLCKNVQYILFTLSAINFVLLACFSSLASLINLLVTVSTGICGGKYMYLHCPCQCGSACWLLLSSLP